MSIIISADHPAWTAIDDDDWNGATFANYLRSYGGQPTVLRPPKNWPVEKVAEMVRAFEASGSTVEVTQVHILQFGHSYCGMPGLPCDWPAYAKWVSFEDPKAAEMTTCLECLEGFKAAVKPGRTAGG